MFIDKAKIYVEGGKGGDGHVSFRHEKGIEFGGPDGGNGGKGGSCYFVAQKGPNTLSAYRHAIKVKAPDGENGGIKQMTGRAGGDIFLTVPLGTVITDLDGNVLADLSQDGQEFLCCRGGRGGKGNLCYVNSVRRAPKFGENGLPGEKKELYLELKLLADCGLVGLPNAGKSTFLSEVSNACPKIADYPFTTLEPMLGTVRLSDEESFVIADLPGLIKGASSGRGLGFVFLRHIERCRVIIHVIDISSEDSDPYENFKTINKELEEYKMDLLNRPMLVALNKMDCLDAEKKADEFEKKLKADYGDKYKVFRISAIEKKGLKPLLREAYELTKTTNPFPIYKAPSNEEKVYDAKIDALKSADVFNKNGLKIMEAPDGAFLIMGDKVIKEFRVIRNTTKGDSTMAILSYLNSIHIDEALKKAGARNGDTVRIDDFDFNYYE